MMLNYEIDYLTLVSGVDVFIPDLMLSIRQPKIREIALLGEKTFYSMCSFLLINKEVVITKLSENIPIEEVKKVYDPLNEYEVLLSLMTNDKKLKMEAMQVMTLIFPDYNINFEELGIILVNKDDKISIVYSENYEILKNYIKEILCLNGKASGDDFNPANDAAKVIADKLKKRHQKLKELNSTEDTYVIANYLSALGAGSNALTIHDGLDLTLYQLFDWLKRYSAWDDYRVSISAMVAGAKDVKLNTWFGNLEK